MASDRREVRFRPDESSTPTYSTKPRFRMNVSPDSSMSSDGNAPVPSSKRSLYPRKIETFLSVPVAPNFDFINMMPPVTPIPRVRDPSIQRTPRNGMPALPYTSPAPPAFTPHINHHHPHPEFPLFYAQAPRIMADQGTQTVPGEEDAVLDLRSQLALDFAGNIFDGIIPDTMIGGRQRKAFNWPKGIEIGPEDRLLVVLRAIKKAGFSTLGSFLRRPFETTSNITSTLLFISPLLHFSRPRNTQQQTIPSPLLT